MSSLDGFSRAIALGAEQRDKARKELNKKLGKPAAFIPNEGDPAHGTGFWKADGGVFSYRKYSNGYDPNSRVEYTDEFIALLVKIQKSR